MVRIIEGLAVAIFAFFCISGSANGFLADNVTYVPNTITPVVSTTAVTTDNSSTAKVCQDTINSCSDYGRTMCTNTMFEDWARYHCALYCGFCTLSKVGFKPLECIDKVPDCPEYDDGTLCTAESYHTWAYDNCKGYCRFDTCNGTACEDQTGIDCNALDSAIKVCADAQKAKLVCRHYCGICDLVDGQWSTWLPWGDCGVTCGNGSQTRQRQCNKPPPSHGGLYCQGNDKQTQGCIKPHCPVHGNWGTWSPWGSCSVTCEEGLQRRDRYCDNPYPSRHGDHCFGTPIDFRICQLTPCSDDKWSGWSHWSQCPSSCKGVSYRERNCSSPSTLSFGTDCVGKNIETKQCDCKDSSTLRLVGGTFSGRLEVFYNGTWGTVCDDDFTNQSATIVCKMLNYPRSNVRFTKAASVLFLPPHTSKIWLDDIRCSGGDTNLFNCQHSQWGVNDCSHGEDVVIYCISSLPSFTATNPVPGLTSGTVAMSNVVSSVGADYNPTTGFFTCSVPGIYYFTVTLTRIGAYRTYYVHCFLRLNDANMQLIQMNPLGTSYESDSASVSMTYYLRKGDIVDIGSCSNATYFDSVSSSFTGYLVKKD